MIVLGLEEFSFSEVFDQEKVDDGKKLSKIGNLILTLFNCLFRENIERKRYFGFRTGFRVEFASK
jgi:hypothetical protein